MTRIAHLSDLHLLEDGWRRRSTSERWRLHYLSVGRPLDAEERRKRALASLRSAARADLVVITGDLTEDGTDAQFEVLAELLQEAGVDPQRTFIVPGNHDAYHDFEAFERALEGPLASYAATSRPGTVTVTDSVALVSVSTALPQPYTRSAGHSDDHHLERVAKLASVEKRAVVAIQHHPPGPSGHPVYNWIDGNQNHRSNRALLETNRAISVLHGHIHRSVNRRLPGDRSPRVFATTAVVDGSVPVRFYEVEGQRLVAEDSRARQRAHEPGRHGPAGPVALQRRVQSSRGLELNEGSPKVSTSSRPSLWHTPT